MADDFSAALVPKTADFNAALVPRDLEAERAANPTVAPVNQLPLVSPSGERLPGGGGPSTEALAGRRAAFKSGAKAYGATSGAILAPELLPELGPVAGWLLKPVVSGAGATLGTLAAGGTPKEASEAGAVTAGTGLVLGGAGLGLKTAARSGVFGTGLANYFAEGANGAAIPTDRMRDIQRVNEAMGLKPSQIKIGLGAAGPEDAWNLPGRSVLDRVIVPSRLSVGRWENMTPFERASAVKPALDAAGANIERIADAATKRGVTLDAEKSLIERIGAMEGATQAETDALQNKALTIAHDAVTKLGIKDVRTATPNQVLALRRMMWEQLPRGYRNPMYGAFTRDLKEAVPEIVPEDLAFTELKTSGDALTNQMKRFSTRAGPTQFEQMLDLLKKHPAISAPLGVGGAASSLTGLYEGGKALSGWLRDLTEKP